MGLGRQLAQGQLSPFQRVALGAKCGVAQTRGVLPGAGRGLMWRPAVRPTASHSIVARAAGAVAGAESGAVFTVTKLTAPPRHCRLGLFHTWPIVAPHRHHRASHGFGHRFLGSHRRLLGWRIGIAFV